MKKGLFLIAIFIICQITVMANSTDTTRISAKPLFIIFSNFHQGISESAHESNFDVKRAYLGYDFNLNNGFTANIKIDIGSPDDNSQYSLIRRSAYFKTVGIGYTKNKLNINFGIIDNQQYKMQEKFWGKRYIFKTFTDEYKFLSSSDLGINAVYKFNNKISLEAGIMNGEYLNNQDGFLKYIYNFGVNYLPIEVLSFKFYSSYTGNNNDLLKGGIFVGIKPSEKIMAGAEFDSMFDLKETGDFITYGYSLFCNYKIAKKWSLFGRYDSLNSNIPDGYTIPFNLSKNGSAIIGGVEYQVNENVRLSLNYQDWYPMAANMSNTAYLYFNLEFGIYESYKRI